MRANLGTSPVEVEQTCTLACLQSDDMEGGHRLLSSQLLLAETFVLELHIPI